MNEIEATILVIARLISAKQKLVRRKRADEVRFKEMNPDSVAVRIYNDSDDEFLFDSSSEEQEINEIMDSALISRMSWIIDNVYDKAIQDIEKEIETNTQFLKQHLNKVEL